MIITTTTIIIIIIITIMIMIIIMIIAFKGATRDFCLQHVRSLTDNLISINDYTVLRRDSGYPLHTGLALYVHKSIENSVRRRLELLFMVQSSRQVSLETCIPGRHLSR